MTDPDEADDADREPDHTPEEKTPPPSPVLTTKKPLVPISGAEVRTVPGGIVRPEPTPTGPSHPSDDVRAERPGEPPGHRGARAAVAQRVLPAPARPRTDRAGDRDPTQRPPAGRAERPTCPSGDSLGEEPRRTRSIWDYATTTVELELPSCEELFPFTGTAEIEWRVVDAAVVVRDNIHDVRDAFTPALRRRLRDVTRRYPTTELGSAEAAACTELEGWDPGAHYGLRATVLLPARRRHAVGRARRRAPPGAPPDRARVPAARPQDACRRARAGAPGGAARPLSQRSRGGRRRAVRPASSPPTPTTSRRCWRSSARSRRRSATSISRSSASCSTPTRSTGGMSRTRSTMPCGGSRKPPIGYGGPRPPRAPVGHAAAYGSRS